MSRKSTAGSKTSGGTFDIDAKKRLIEELEEKAAQPDFWNDANTAKAILRDIKNAKRIIEPWEKARNEGGDLAEFLELALAEEDSATLAELAGQAGVLEKELDHIEFIRKLSGEDDDAPAILTIHSGAGGTESCDWTEMLLRMYMHWIERRGFSATILDAQPGDEAGLKSVTVEVHGDYIYGHLRSECGVHRLVRISPFDSNARRHTSFASVYAYPVVEEVDEFEIEEKDIRVDTYRASGAGGQHINKTDSAVRMTHIPTNIVVACQNERSQIKNRAVALRLLKARVRQHYKEIEAQERQSKLAEKKKIEWGSQIRSYVLHPYNMVKDHRTDTETSNTQAVLDGDIDAFIESYLLSR
ncbi:MAG: peptide chain release factor 2 [Chitinispirillaceae bacterium]|nr:peptide chain release factor 2 [Chitinispirillaceae bacterium]